MRRYVINLDRDTARLAWMTDAFRRVGLCFERYAAVNKDQLSDEAVSRASGNAGWSRGEIACFLSHVAVWKQIALGAEPYAAIFEDDVHLSPNAAFFLTETSWIPPDVDLIKLETTLNPVRVGERKFDFAGHGLVKLQSFHNGSAGYIISRQHAALLAASADQIDRPVDDFIFDLHKATCWQLSPAICIQDMFLPGSGKIASTLEQGRQDARGAKRLKTRQSFLQKLVRETKRLVSKVMGQRRAVIPFAILPNS
ncbi:glycosyltransferase family 25 protein [Aminobacter carboxidus]|uniref:Glycosyltransferase family 25 protein n=1 Tax=Aminobacter carboxidus TaxID=376165 RepID=A0ABR9GWN4_9HYPH|nr:glycosyltransferase family 25 protein [Aminobacter carboxidus]MBE1208098.1 glycosyltransferase family 25 protein [Aminobacter carboxidus]